MKDETFLDLRRFLDRLRSNGDLRVVDAPVDPRLEIAEIHRRVIAAGGPALLFTHPAGTKMPVVTNLFGTAGRAGIAFGHRPSHLVRSLVRLVEGGLPPSASTLWECNHCSNWSSTISTFLPTGAPAPRRTADSVSCRFRLSANAGKSRCRLRSKRVSVSLEVAST